MKETAMCEFWTENSVGLTESTIDALKGEQRAVWLKLINDNRVKGEHLNVLDAGCGAGFFPILLAQEGHEITAIDLSDGMLEQSQKNAKYYGVEDKITFIKMDAQHTIFDDNSFDLIVSRNISWMFSDLAEAYSEWYRILKPGGRFLNFDGNWFLHLYDDKLMEEYLKNLELAKQLGYKCTDIHRASPEEIERMMKSLPMSCKRRPDWDLLVLDTLGYDKVMIDRQLPSNVMRKEIAVKNQHTPMFMVCVEKS